MTAPINREVWLIWRVGCMTVHSTSEAEALAIYQRMKADRRNAAEVVLARGTVTEIRRSPE